MTWRDRLRSWRRTVTDFLLGASFSWTVVPHLLNYRHQTERILAFILNAQLVGMPLLPATGTLRLLPYFMPVLLSWRRMSIFERALEGADLRHIGH